MGDWRQLKTIKTKMKRLSFFILLSILVSTGFAQKLNRKAFLGAATNSFLKHIQIKEKHSVKGKYLHTLPVSPVYRTDTFRRPIIHNTFQLPPSFKLTPQMKYELADSMLVIGDTALAARLFQQSAMEGYVEAQYMWGLYLITGKGVKKDEKQGWPWIKKAAVKGHPKAQYRVGLAYYEGNYFPKDTVQGFQWLAKAADKNEIDALIVVGDIYNERSDFPLAIKYYTMADVFADKNPDKIDTQLQSYMAQVRYNLGYYYYNAMGTEKDVSTAVKYWAHSANWGHAEAQYIIGNYYMHGEYTARDSLRAICWYKQAAEAGVPEAQYDLMLCYSDAEINDSTILWGTQPACRDSSLAQINVGYAYYKKKDYNNAATWWKKAAEQNEVIACLNLVYLYEDDIKDSVASLHYLKKAAELGSPEANNNMGINYILGHMVDKDVTKAIYYFKRSADAGLSIACNNLGIIYFGKEYGIKDRKLAALYWKRGAELGSPKCQYGYGTALIKGHGVKKDKEQGIRWLTLAAQNGSEDAMAELRKIGIEIKQKETSTKESEEDRNAEFSKATFSLLQ